MNGAPGTRLGDDPTHDDETVMNGAPNFVIGDWFEVRGRLAGRVRIGIDLGGTKIEGLALDEAGAELARLRVATPQHDYAATVKAIVDVVVELERQVGASEPATVGVGIPGTMVQATGLVKNANSTWLNGQPLEQDLSHGTWAPCSVRERCELPGRFRGDRRRSGGRGIGVCGDSRARAAGAALRCAIPEARACMLGRMGLRASGDITRCRGQAPRSCRGRCAIAVRLDVWRRGSPARGWRTTTGG